MTTRLPYTKTDAPDGEEYEVGYYLPTEEFKAIPEHVAVMRAGTGELIAVTGPSEPGATAEGCARLFCAAPKLRAVCEAVVLRGHTEGCISRGRGYIAPGKPTCDCLCGMAQAALAQVRGGR